MLRFTEIPIRYSIPGVLIFFFILITGFTGINTWVSAQRKSEEQQLRYVSRRMVELQGYIENLALAKNETEIQRLLSFVSTLSSIEYSFVTDDQGLVIYSPRRAYLNKKLRDILPEAAVSRITASMQNPGGEVVLLEDRDHIAGVFPVFLADPANRIRSRKKGFYIELHYIGGDKTETALENLQRSQIPVIVFVLFLTLTGIFFYYRLNKRLTVIIHTTDHLAKGNLDFRTGLEGNDELAVLGRSVDKMAASLKESRNQIQRQNEDLYKTLKLLEERSRQIEEIYSTDPLTGLANRSRLQQDLLKKNSAAIALINIDRFSEINDFYGSQIGDQVIRAIGSRLTQILHGFSLSLYHLQADEFAVLSSDYTTLEFTEITRTIIANLQSREFQIEGQEIPVNATAAIATSDSGRDIMAAADMALRYAKNEHQDLILFTETLFLSETHQKNLYWTSKIRKALAMDRIMPFYQSISDNRTGEISKYECLIRMDDPPGPEISPSEFIDIAKKTRIYPLLTKIMIEKTFRFFQKNGLSFSVNLTAEDIRNQGTTDFLFRKIREFGLGNRLTIEIVESESIQNFKNAMEFIKALKAEGCSLAIDDFGTGYSNFNYLLQLDPDYIKIDGSLIQQINSNPQAAMIIEIIVEFSKRNGILTIAEFVSDAEIHESVKKMGIDFSQGYFIGKPDRFLKTGPV